MLSNEKSLSDIITNLSNRVVAFCNPNKIVLYGQALSLSGEAVELINLLLIMPDGTHRRKTAIDLRQEIGSIGIPYEIIVATSEDIEMYGNEPAMIYSGILSEGREIYTSTK